MKKLLEFKNKLEFLPVHDFLQYVLYSTELVEKLTKTLSQQKINKVISNIEKFIEFSLDTDFGKFPSLSKFLQKIELATRHKDFEGLNVSFEDEFEAVSIQTLHSMKGLESRIVVLAGMNEPENYDKNSIRWIYALDNNSENISELFTYRTDDLKDPKLIRLLNYEKALIEQEKLNLLYVAITRCKEILILSAARHEQKNENWFDFVSNFSNELKIQ